WYMGRTTHIHVKVHVGGTVVHTGQLYFNDAITDAVYAKAPYTARGARDTTNATDGIYAGGGARSTLRLRKREQGYRGKMLRGGRCQQPHRRRRGGRSRGVHGRRRERRREAHARGVCELQRSAAPEARRAPLRPARRERRRGAHAGRAERGSSRSVRRISAPA